jgi:hypothetical protein
MSFSETPEFQLDNRKSAIQKKKRRGETTTKVKSRPGGGLVAAQRRLSGGSEARPNELGVAAPPHEPDDSK